MNTNSPMLRRDNSLQQYAKSKQLLVQPEYTENSVAQVVAGIAHILDHFSDRAHPGLREPQNRPRVYPDTGVVVRPNQAGRANLIGFQIFLGPDSPDAPREGYTAGIIFDLHGLEKHGDTYFFNMLKNLSQQIREAQRPSDSQLRDLSERFRRTN